MERQTIALVGVGLVLATPPLRGQERSYSATKDVVWNAVHEAFTGLQIAITKEDKDKGEIQSDPAPTSCHPLLRTNQVRDRNGSLSSALLLDPATLAIRPLYTVASTNSANSFRALRKGSK